MTKKDYYEQLQANKFEMINSWEYKPYLRTNQPETKNMKRLVTKKETKALLGAFQQVKVWEQIASGQNSKKCFQKFNVNI